MSKQISTKIIFLAFGVLVVFGFWFAYGVRAGTGDNIQGWAWSNMADSGKEGMGWLSFNSMNCDTDGDLTYEGAGEKDVPAPAGCPVSGPVRLYGVNIEPSGNFSGYAWSENIGWINFAPVGPYPACPATYTKCPAYSACLDLPGATVQNCDGIGDYNIDGWARACSVLQDVCNCGESCNTVKSDAEKGGWDGWIKLAGGGASVAPPCTGDNDYDNNNFCNWGVKVDPADGALSGFAWGDMILGWIKFPSSGGARVWPLPTPPNTPPYQPIPGGSGGADGITWDHCSFQGKSVPTFNWTYSDPDDIPPGTDPQTAYEIRIRNNAGFPSSPSPTEFFDSVSGSGKSYTPTHRLDEWAVWMNWDSNYWWIVRVKDDHGNWSNWSNAIKFDEKTPLHAYPYPGFSWDPLEPTQKEVVVFTPDQSGIDEYAWTINRLTGTGYQFVDGTDILDETPHIKFLTFDNTVELKVTDYDGYSCESPEPIEITAEYPLPEYKEIPPIIWLKKTLVAFAGLIDGLYFFKNF
ncbi:MAG: hypothetical protein ABIG29_00680 [Candidatus Nealsonbacteria bacterium]